MLAYAFYEKDTRIRQYAMSLAERGDAVDVIALRGLHQNVEGDVEGVHVYRIQQRAVNERHTRAYLLRILHFLLRSAWKLVSLNHKQRYDVIHVHNVPDFLVFSALFPRLTGTRVILDIHDILPEFYASKFSVDSQSLSYKILMLIEKISIAFSDHVIIANDIWRERLLSRSVAPGKCTTVINYPDSKIFAPRPRYSDGKFHILYPGSLNHHQGLDVAIRAFTRIAGQMPDAEFAIYGEGPERAALIKLTHDLGMEDRIRIFDSVATAEIAGVMANADLAIVPKRASSTFGTEAASTKIMEFMAVRVPVIVSRTTVDSHYFNGSLVKFFDSEDEAALASAMLQLYRSPRLRLQLAENASRYVAEYCWDAKKLEYLALVDRLAARRPPHASTVRAASEPAHE